MSRYIDLRSKQFGRLKPLRHIGTKWDCALWLCGCRCGNYTERCTSELCRTKRPITSCGFCLDHERYPKEYIAWRNMKTRCSNENSKDYKNYGAKGIEVCVFYREDFFNFLEDVGLAPGEEYTIDRKDSAKNYEPGNVRWATRTVQSLNRDNIHSALSKLKLRLLTD
jgi:hypothetical protein